ncbi:MAG: hypothetical protein IJH84_09785, partial [Saccharopolyspora sp.]|nr:hypothetical protein [Saccharopolyspora sp.]
MQAMLNPRRIEADPQRFSRPRTAELSYQRARANLHVSMATTLKPVLDDSAPVTRSEYEMMSRELTARNKVGHARGWNVTSAGFVGSVFLGYLGGSQHDGHLAQGQGIGVVNTSPYSTSRGAETTRGVESGHRTRIENPAQPVYLARVKVHAGMVAEGRYRGNLDPFNWFPDRSGVRRRGNIAELPGTQLMWLTKDQLDELRPGLPEQDGTAAPDAPVRPDEPAEAGPSEPPPRAEQDGPAEPPLPVPPALDPQRAVRPSFGLGGIIDPVDLRDQLGQVRTSLAERYGAEVAQALLPQDSAGNWHQNQDLLNTLLSDVNDAAKQTMNGGERTELRYERRFRGNTYHFALEAEFTPRGDGKLVHANKLKVTNLATPSVEKKASRARTMLSTMLGARLGGRGSEIRTGPEHHPSYGAAGTGGQLQSRWGFRKRTGTETEETGLEHSAETIGPVAEYGGDLRLKLRVGRNEESFTDAVAVDRPVAVTKLLEESLPAPDSRYGQVTRRGRVPEAEHTPEALADWQEQGHPQPVPDTQWGEHFFGDVQEVIDAARGALGDTGVRGSEELSRTLTSSITLAQLLAGLPVGGFNVPLHGLGRTLEVRARFPDAPKFSSTSDAVELLNKIKPKIERSSELETGHTSEVRQTEPWGMGGERHASDRHAFGQHSGYFARDLMALSSRDPAKLTQTGELHSYEAERQPTADSVIHNEETLTRALLNNVEFRVVARENPSGMPLVGSVVDGWRGLSTGARDVAFRDAYVNRMYDDVATEHTGHTLSPELAQATKDLKEKGKTYREATQQLVAAREEAQRQETRQQDGGQRDGDSAQPGRAAEDSAGRDGVAEAERQESAARSEFWKTKRDWDRLTVEEQARDAQAREQARRAGLRGESPPQRDDRPVRHDELRQHAPGQPARRGHRGDSPLSGWRGWLGGGRPRPDPLP